jgi:hypothetical protein
MMLDGSFAALTATPIGKSARVCKLKASLLLELLLSLELLASLLV